MPVHPLSPVEPPFLPALHAPARTHARTHARNCWSYTDGIERCAREPMVRIGARTMRARTRVHTRPGAELRCRRGFKGVNGAVQG